MGKQPIAKRLFFLLLKVE